MGYIAQLIARYFSSNPTALARAGAIASTSFSTGADVAKWVGSNKLNLALLLPSLGSVAYTVKDWLENDPQVTAEAIEIIKAYRYTPDSLADSSSVSINELGKYADEFEKIDRVAARVGGREVLADLLSVIKMDTNILELESQVRRLNKR